MALKSISTVVLRSASYVAYVGIATLSLSRTNCLTFLDTTLNLTHLGLLDLTQVNLSGLCTDLAGQLTSLMLLLLLLYAVCMLLVWPLAWREATNEMGNVDETEAVHGLRRGLGLRELSRALRREMYNIGIIVGLCVLAIGELQWPTTLADLSGNTHLKLLFSALLLVLAAALLNPIFDVVPHVAKWLKRRIYTSGRS